MILCKERPRAIIIFFQGSLDSSKNNAREVNIVAIME